MGHGLNERVVGGICGVLARYPLVERAVLYGSRAKGNHRNGSDIDLVIEGEGLDMRMLFRILDEIDDLPIPHTVDLSIMSNIIDNDLLDHIERVGVVFYERGKGAMLPLSV